MIHMILITKESTYPIAEVIHINIHFSPSNQTIEQLTLQITDSSSFLTFKNLLHKYLVDLHVINLSVYN